MSSVSTCPVCGRPRALGRNKKTWSCGRAVCRVRASERRRNLLESFARCGRAIDPPDEKLLGARAIRETFSGGKAFTATDAETAARRNGVHLDPIAFAEFFAELAEDALVNIVTPSGATAFVLPRRRGARTASTSTADAAPSKRGQRAGVKRGVTVTVPVRSEPASDFVASSSGSSSDRALVIAMIETAFVALAVPTVSATNRVAPGSPTALVPTVDLTAVALPANRELRMAAPTIVESVIGHVLGRTDLLPRSSSRARLRTSTRPRATWKAGSWYLLAFALSARDLPVLAARGRLTKIVALGPPGADHTDRSGRSHTPEERATIEQAAADAAARTGSDSFRIY